MKTGVVYSITIARTQYRTLDLNRNVIGACFDPIAVRSAKYGKAVTIDVKYITMRVIVFRRDLPNVSG